MKHANVFSSPVRLGLYAREQVDGVRGAEAARLAHRYDAAAEPRITLSARELDEHVIAEWLTSDDQVRRRMALNALSDRMQLFGDLVTGHRTVRFSSTSNFPDVKHEGLPVAVELTDADRQRVDMRWTALYTVQDRRSEPWPGYFKLRDLYHAVTVKRYIPGQQIEFGAIEAAETILEHFLYGTGLQWNQLMMAGRWDRTAGIAAMQVKWANELARLAYQTITASGLTDIAYDLTGANQLEKDVNTINAATLDIRKSLFEATAPKNGQQLEEIIPPGTSFYLLYNDNTAGYEDRITAALSVRYEIIQQGGTTTAKEVNRPIIPLGSPYIPTGKWYVVLPGRKNVFSLFRDLRFFDFTDARVAGVAEGEVGWGAHRHVRGDVNQARSLSLA